MKQVHRSVSKATFERYGACPSGQRKFMKFFPKGRVSINVKNVMLAEEHHLDIWWLLDMVLSYHDYNIFLRQLRDIGTRRENNKISEEAYERKRAELIVKTLQTVDWQE